MKVFNKYYLFKDDISLLDRRFFFSLVAVAFVNLFVYDLILALNIEFSLKSAFLCCDDNLWILIGAILLSGVHFVLYYRHLKNNTECIVSENGIITRYEDISYFLPWSVIGISNKTICASSVQSNLFIENDTLEKFQGNIDDDFKMFLKSKIFEFKQIYFLGMNEKYYTKKQGNMIAKFQSWKNDSDIKNRGKSVQKCGKINFLKHISIILFGYSLAIYIAGFGILCVIL